MRKVERSTKLACGIGLLALSLVIAPFSVGECGIQSRLCSKMNSLIITWTQVAGSFAFSQGTINPAHLYVRSESEPLDSSEKSLTSEGLRCQLEPVFEEGDASELSARQLAEQTTNRYQLTSVSQRVSKLKKVKRKEILAKVRPVIEPAVAAPIPAPEVAEAENALNFEEGSSPFTVEFSEGVINIEAETLLEPFSETEIILTATPLTEPQPKFEPVQTESELNLKPNPCSARPSVEPLTLPVPFLRPPFEKF